MTSPPFSAHKSPSVWFYFLSFVFCFRSWESHMTYVCERRLARRHVDSTALIPPDKHTFSSVAHTLSSALQRAAAKHRERILCMRRFVFTYKKKGGGGRVSGWCSVLHAAYSWSTLLSAPASSGSSLTVTNGCFQISSCSLASLNRVLVKPQLLL